MNIDFESLLKEHIGLDTATIGSATIERAIQKRMAECGCKTQTEYWRLLHKSESELKEFIEGVVIPETWFYRHREAFEALRQWVLQTRFSPKANAPLRILSVPCATGEEPYSIAMTLLDLGMHTFQIDGVDISDRALERAKRAVYGRNSFRASNLAFREKYFTPKGQNHEIIPAVREHVRLQYGNLIDPNFLRNRGPYDAIFCRNVLIYFDIPTQATAVKTLSGLLAEDGLLFVGPAETGMMINYQFASAKIPQSFAFRKASSMPVVQVHATPAKRKKHPVAKAAPVRVMPPPQPARPVAPSPAPASKTPEVSLEQIGKLADEGRLPEAGALCQKFIKANPGSAQAFYLLGVVQDASGDDHAASESYRKALYLDPQHGEALVHLALIKQKHGDAAGARALRARAQRLSPKGAAA